MTLTSDKPLRKPYFNKISAGGLFLRMDLEMPHKKPTTIEGLKAYLESCKKLSKDVLVWVTCPKCGLEVPKIDLTVCGTCYFCTRDEDLNKYGSRKERKKDKGVEN